jgi:hypothetical protein
MTRVPPQNAGAAPDHAAPEASAARARPPLNHLEVVRLQASVGNQAVLRLRSRQLQPKRTISSVGDPLERQADLVAQHAPRPAALSPSAAVVPGTEQSYLGGLTGRGVPLPASVREPMEVQLQTDLRDVRIHTDAAASRSAERMGALAYTASPHIVFRRDHYEPGSREGRRLIAHELAHVVQQDDRAAAHVLHRFEAPMHQRAERVGLTTDAQLHPDPSGLTDEEASNVYFGNWMRDLNQVYVPMLHNLGLPDDLVFVLLSYMAARKFGREMTPEQFGYYIPAEHIDNPAGLTNEDDLLPGPPTITSYAGPPAPVREAALNTPQQDVSPSASITGGSGDTSRLFDVDQTGTMVHIRRTNLHVERRLDLAVRRGRNPEGDMHFGAALHAIEDLFAHSNWVEMAVSQLLASDQRLLPQLRGADRHVFTYSPEVSVPHHRTRRPVLTTGTFVGADTQVSVGSELVGFLSRPLDPPRGYAEERAEQRLLRALIHQFHTSLENNPAFSAGVQAVLRQAGVPDAIAQQAHRVPVEQLYDLSTLLPFLVPEDWHRRISQFERDFLSNNILQPLGHRLQADALDARIEDTSLLQFRRAQQQTAQGQFSAADLAMQQQIERLTGRTVATQQREAIVAAGRHVAALDATPEAVLAGPSHSQIAKDHANSPFFGLAFALAAEAVRRMRLRMIAAWDEALGHATTPFDFQYSAYPSQAPGETPEQPTEARSLYHETRHARGDDSREQRARGEAIIARGGEDVAPFDLAAMRRDSGDQLRFAAGAIRAIANAPGATATVLQQLQGLLSALDHERSDRLRAQLASASAGLQTLAAGQAVARLGALAAELDTLAGTIEGARRHDARAASNEQLRAFRARLLTVLATTPTADRGLSASLLDLLDQEISFTQPTYTSEQRRLVEGQSLPASRRPHVPGLAHPAALRVHRFGMPDLATTADGHARSPAHRALIAEARLLLDHPYENPWWRPIVRAYVAAHPAQLMADIEARNEGVPLFRRPGAHP